MTSSQLLRITGTLRIVPEYTCSRCGRFAQGETMRLDLDVSTPQGVAALLEYKRLDAHHMPQGWSYTGEFKCPKCLTEPRP